MKATLDACVSEMAAAGELFPWTKRAAYMGWLAQTYYYVRHSTRLLAVAAGRFPHTRQGDTLHLRFGAHIGEEKRHELLCVRDIQALGGSIEAIAEQPTTRMFMSHNTTRSSIARRALCSATFCRSRSSLHSVALASSSKSRPLSAAKARNS